MGGERGTRRSGRELITYPGIIEVLVALNELDGSATMSQLRQAGVPNPLDPLRALAVDGYLQAPGTFDNAVHADTAFTLTSRGTGLADIMTDIVALSRRVNDQQASASPRLMARLRRLLAGRHRRPAPKPTVPGASAEVSI